MAAKFRITDGIRSFDLLGGPFHIEEWSPGGMSFKEGGYWQDSAFSDGRRLNQYSFSNVVETITVSQSSISHDDAIREINSLSRLILDAANYSSSQKHGRRPVYIEAKSTRETNTRYALIHNGTVGEYGNPFSQPFMQPGCKATVSGLTIILERGPWLESPPGSDVCQYISPTGTPSEATFYDYDDVILGTQPPLITWPAFALWKLNETSGSTAANSSSFPGLDGTYDTGNTLADQRFWNVVDPSAFLAITNGGVDIYSAAFEDKFDGNEGSLITWVNTSGPIWTGGNDAYFINIQATATEYLRIYHPAAPDNSIIFIYATGGEIYEHTVSSFSPTYEWFSLGMTWSTSQEHVSFYLNGSLQFRQYIPTTWSGALTSTTVNIGSLINDGTSASVSNQAYTAVWNAPLTDSDMALIGVPSEGFVIQNELDCDDVVAYVGNKRNTARLTHAFTYDASLTTYGSNIIGASPPFGLLPNPVAANDIVYFGVQASSGSGLPDGPFSSLVLDIATAAASTGTYTYVWEYWSGATWSSLSGVVDNTTGLKEEGVNSVHWEQPSNWAATTINSVSAYWVRLRVTGFSGTWTQPVGQDNPYTVVSNTVDIPSSAVGGSLPAISRIRFDVESSQNQLDADDGFIERAVVGLRTVNLAPNFVSYINLSDEQNIQGITVSVSTDAAFQNDPVAVTGRSIRLAGGGSDSLIERFKVSIDPAISSSYFGSFKVFVLYEVQVGSSTALSTHLLTKIGSGYGYSSISAGTYIKSQASPAPGYTLHEIGEISILPDSFVGDGVDSLELIWYSTTSGTLDVDFYAMVLIPTDEWFGDFATTPDSSFVGGYVHNDRYLSIDGTRYANRAVVADVREKDTDLSVSRWKQSHNGPPIVLPEGRQKLHFLFAKTDELSSPSSTYTYSSLPHISGRIKMFRNRRYHYGRGNE